MKIKLGVDDQLLDPDELEKCREQMRRYKEKRLTKDVAKEYQELGSGLDQSIRGDLTELRQLEKELMDEYGVSELEATNILKGMHCADYVRKYDDLSNGMW